MVEIPFERACMDALLGDEATLGLFDQERRDALRTARTMFLDGAEDQEIADLIVELDDRPVRLQ